MRLLKKMNRLYITWNWEPIKTFQIAISRSRTNKSLIRPYSKSYLFFIWAMPDIIEQYNAQTCSKFIFLDHDYSSSTPYTEYFIISTTIEQDPKFIYDNYDYTTHLTNSSTHFLFYWVLISILWSFFTG